MAESIAIAQAIETAEHNGWYVGTTLVVFDALKNDRYYGIRLEVYPAASSVGGWCALCRDGVGRAFSVWNPSASRELVAQRALDGYLKILNHGI